ncbi:hypothetical protein Salat_0649800 [Sesamum alatum]|uniref:Uncharacterized protein n=1 Tax=Sesamum alatum TaxID=300844 RepID=A0AAE2CUS0_9LAMI|nr:hypothetical protein Salat_0649800 [Sesamum alatum]
MAVRLVSAEELAVEIFRSFSESLAVLSSCAIDDSAQIRIVDSDGSSSSSGETNKKPRVRDRRGGRAAAATTAATSLELWCCDVVRIWVAAAAVGLEGFGVVL